MKIISVRNLDKFEDIIRPKSSKKYKKTVESILLDVQKRGDSALKYYENKFGGIKLGSLLVTKREISDAYSKISNSELNAIKTVKQKLVKTELKLKQQLKNFNLNSDGVKISKQFSPIESVGCYVPGGLARYPSSAIMSIIPAKVAGVKRITVVSPPNQDGQIDPLTLVAADICGANEIYKTGGAQAIAALAYGTKSIKKVDKITGPGGSFVTIAKSLVSDSVSIDMQAGPTELGIIADNSANPEFVAVDIISQAEHSEDTFCYLLTTSNSFAKNIKKIINKKLKNLERNKIIKKSLTNNGFVALCKTENQAIEIANKLAPEHLEIMTKNPKKTAKKIVTPGLVLLGDNSPSSASDYLMGSNHILPTNGFGRARGSLSVLDFIRLGTQIEASRSSLQKLSKYMKSLTSAEGLPNHYEAVRSRL